MRLMHAYEARAGASLIIIVNLVVIWHVISSSDERVAARSPLVNDVHFDSLTVVIFVELVEIGAVAAGSAGAMLVAHLQSVVELRQAEVHRSVLITVSGR